MSALFAASPALAEGKVETSTYAAFACCSSGASVNENSIPNGVSSWSRSSFSGPSYDDVSTASSAARADLSTGEIGVKAISRYFGEASAEALHHDYLYFKVAGATANTLTPLGIVLKWHGVLGSGLTPYDGRSWSDYNFLIGNGIYNGSFQIDAGSSNGDNAVYTIQHGGFSSFDSFNEGTTTQYFRMTYYLRGIDPEITIKNWMRATSRLTGSADIFNTASLNLILPDNVTYTSSSGVYLSNASAITIPTSAVPETSTWMMMVLGLGLIGAVLRNGSFQRRLVR